MAEKNNKINRRSFLRTIGAAGVGSVLGSAKAIAEQKDSNTPAQQQEPKLPQVPRRKLGKTGVDVPCLSLGPGAPEEPMLFHKALEWGINYWDTAYASGGGNSELAIGRFLSANPKLREKLFITTKESDSKAPEDLEKCLQTSLERMNTKYVDLYLGVYKMSEPAQLTDEVKQWAQSAKQRKLIRFFGFSTHKNMAQCLTAAAKLDWIDVVMTTYNFRLMQDGELQAAIDACHKAGIGIVVMKTQAHGQGIETEEDKKLTDHFLKRGLTDGQAKIKAVLEDERISSACSRMTSVALLTENASAVLDETALTQTDMEFFKKFAQANCGGYCAGCARICESVLPDGICVSDVMRYLMYYKNYGEKEKAKKLFAQIPKTVRENLLNIDYSIAEARCPQRMPLGKLVTEAVNKLA
jgi:predicted aldo/keto reductase-like oxidoreductase